MYENTCTYSRDSGRAGSDTRDGGHDDGWDGFMLVDLVHKS